MADIIKMDVTCNYSRDVIWVEMILG